MKNSNIQLDVQKQRICQWQSRLQEKEVQRVNGVGSVRFKEPKQRKHQFCLHY